MRRMEVVVKDPGPSATNSPAARRAVNAGVQRALADPKMRERLAKRGGRSTAGTPADFGEGVAHGAAQWEKVVRSSGARGE